jgi:hypothetical protein
VSPLLESGQLIKTDSCTCPEGIITYQCTIDGSQPGGFTIWNGTAFSCGQSNNILLRNNLFNMPTGAFGSCNDGIISGRSLGVSSDGTNIYTSQLQVNVTNGSRSELVGRTVQCVYSPDGVTYNIINSSTILITGNSYSYMYIHNSVSPITKIKFKQLAGYMNILALLLPERTEES